MRCRGTNNAAVGAAALAVECCSMMHRVCERAVKNGHGIRHTAHQKQSDGRMIVRRRHFVARPPVEGCIEHWSVRCRVCEHDVKNGHIIRHTAHHT
jgi:hypothetical protein